MGKNTNGKCVCCGKPGYKRIVFYTATEGKTDRAYNYNSRDYSINSVTETTQYYGFERHEEDFCIYCMMDKLAIKALPCLVIGIIVFIVLGNLLSNGFGDFLIAAACAGVIGVFVCLYYAFPKESNAMINARDQFYEGKAVFDERIKDSLIH